MLPLLSRAIASLDLGDQDLLISSSSAFGHHARKSPGSLHLCYCHTPPRFLWQPDGYFRGQPALRLLLAPLLHRLRQLDLKAARDVDVYVAVSNHVAARVRAVYGREARVVYPPVDTLRFEPSSERSGRFLVVSRLVRSKRVELAVEAATRYSLPLDVIGKGPQLASLKRIAGPSVRFHGWQPDTVVREAMAACEGLVVAGEEDFGLVMVEAQASGRPPVAFGLGGAREIIEDGVTGFLVDAQTAADVAEAMLRARSRHIDVTDLKASAARFDVGRFDDQFSALVDEVIDSRLAMVAG
jgi:glycosyltransferase involved in cell wall biosynthesis